VTADIPVLLPGVDMHSGQTIQPDEQTNRLYQSVSPAVVQVVTDTALGSGFFVGTKGDVVTDAHVILGSGWQDVILPSGQEVRARVTKIDDVHDLAVLHIDSLDPTAQPSVPLGSTQDLQAGSRVWALGHPLGVRQDYISPGTVNSMQTLRQWEDDLHIYPKSVREGAIPSELEAAQTRILIDANDHIEHGNSGGPLVDTNGKLVGVSDLSKTTSSGFTTVEDVTAFLDSPHNKFQISYGLGPGPEARQITQSLKDSPVIASTSLVGGVGLSALAYNAAARGMPAALSAARAAGSVSAFDALRGVDSVGGAVRALNGPMLALGSGALFGVMAKQDLDDLTLHKSAWTVPTSAMSLGADVVGLAGSAAYFIPGLARYGAVGMRAGAIGWLGTHLFLEPAVDDLHQMISARDSGARISHGLSLGFDALGVAGAAALAIGKGDPRWALAGIALSLAGRYLPQFLPIHSNMTITRTDGDPRPPLSPN
jgi:S1-C subfamily serine protease